MFAPIVIAIMQIANPCLLLAPHDIARVLGWTVTTGPARTYGLPGGAGKMCTFAGREGTVIVTVPTKGTGLPVNDLTSDLGSVRTPLHDAYGIGAPAELGRGSALVHVHGADFGITVQPVDAQFADEGQMRALAAALVAHLPRRHLRRT